MKDVLLEQFTACYDEDGWFVALRKALNGVTAEQAVRKPEGADHSIWELVNHTIFWNERWLLRYRGELNQPKNIENTGTFLSGEHDWQKTLDHLWVVMDDWRSRLETITDEKLEEQVNNDEWQVPWRSPLVHQNVHNAYHIGQIVLLRKLQGNWDRSKGVS